VRRRPRDVATEECPRCKSPPGDKCKDRKGRGCAPHALEECIYIEGKGPEIDRVASMEAIANGAEPAPVVPYNDQAQAAMDTEDEIVHLRLVKRLLAREDFCREKLLEARREVKRCERHVEEAELATRSELRRMRRGEAIHE
jgi:hypothetical protein